jgi:hypothetical protein
MNEERIGVIHWYFEPHGKLTPGSIFIHGILPPPLLKIDPPVWKIESPWYFDPLISNQENTMDRGFDIPLGGGSKYHG